MSAVDPAVSRARAVVGLYGDPTVSWSIALDVVLSEPVAADLAAGLDLRCSALTVDNPGLGTPPTPVRFDDEAAADVLARFLDTPYGDHDPLVRVAQSDRQDRLLVAAHHGAVDGLGLLAVLSLLLGDDVMSTARGIGDRASTVGFIRSSVTRLVEALMMPPTRLAADPAQAPGEPRGRQPHGTAARMPGDVTAAVDLPPTRVDTARSVAAAARAVARWNRTHRAPADRLVAAIGASRRDGSAARPDRDTAYFRLRLPPVADADADAHAATVARLLGATSPEPTFPERPPGRGRHGSPACFETGSAPACWSRTLGSSRLPVSSVVSRSTRRLPGLARSRSGWRPRPRLPP